MTCKYSIAKLSPNPDLGDSISVGVLLDMPSEGFKFYFNTDRIKDSSKLFDISPRILIRSFSNISLSLDVIDYKHSLSPFTILKEDNIPNLLEYLGMYSDGIIQFSKPLAIEIDNQMEFEKIAKSILGIIELDEDRRMINSGHLRQRVLKDIVTPLKEKVHTDVKINNSIYQQFYFTIHLDMIGLNGKLNAAKLIDFDNSVQTIQKHLSNLNSTMSLISDITKSAIDKTFVISEEPNSNNSEEYKIWEIINHRDSQFEVINPEELHKIVETVNSNNSKRFLPLPPNSKNSFIH